MNHEKNQQQKEQQQHTELWRYKNTIIIMTKLSYDKAPTYTTKTLSSLCTPHSVRASATETPDPSNEWKYIKDKQNCLHCILRIHS